MNSSTGNYPDIDPANNGSLAGVMQFAFYKLLQSTDGMLPATVIAYDRATNRVQVQLSIAVVTTTGAQISRPQIASLPVMLLGGGGFFLSFNLKTGDRGWVIANDRDISLFLQNYTEAAPNTARVKNFSDGLFIPDVMTGYTIATQDTNNAVLQSLDGTVKVSLGTGIVTVMAPIVNVNGIMFNSSGAATSTNPISFTAPSISINGYSFSSAGYITPTSGTAHFVGNINASGSINPFTP